MGVDRRKFLKAIGLTSVAGAAGASGMKLLADEIDVNNLPDSLEAVTPEALEKSLAAETPLTAHRWAMAIDINKCLEQDDCDICIKACHLDHNVPEFDNPKDEVKWIWKEEFKHAFHEQENEFIKDELKHSTPLLLCNHCDNPPCVKVCPTQATWKREDGIVMMDWHRCIGCRYCIAGCPYGSRSFNWRDPRPFIKEIQDDYPTRTRGVVEKCTFCDERLAKGQLQSCVEACKEGAMMFGDLEDPESDIRKALSSSFSIRRKPALGTQPEVYYIIS
jgi:Fe-S-cluster-containing dehydrogenase component